MLVCNICRLAQPGRVKMTLQNVALGMVQKSRIVLISGPENEGRLILELCGENWIAAVRAQVVFPEAEIKTRMRPRGAEISVPSSRIDFYISRKGVGLIGIPVGRRDDNLRFARHSSGSEQVRGSAAGQSVLSSLGTIGGGQR